MRFLVTVAFVATFAVLPVYGFNSLVLPQLSGMHQAYTQTAEYADKVAQNQ